MFRNLMLQGLDACRSGLGVLGVWGFQAAVPFTALVVRHDIDTYIRSLQQCAEHSSLLQVILDKALHIAFPAINAETFWTRPCLFRAFGICAA